MTFKPNPRFLEELQADPGPRRQLVKAAGKVARRVREHTIMRRKGASSVAVEVDGDEVRVANNDHGAHLDEWGSVNNPPYAPLRTAVRAEGLRLHEHGKR